MTLYKLNKCIADNAFLSALYILITYVNATSTIGYCWICPVLSFVGSLTSKDIETETFVALRPTSSIIINYALL